MVLNNSIFNHMSSFIRKLFTMHRIGIKRVLTFILDSSLTLKIGFLCCAKCDLLLGFFTLLSNFLDDRFYMQNLLNVHTSCIGVTNIRICFWDVWIYLLFLNESLKHSYSNAIAYHFRTLTKDSVWKIFIAWNCHNTTLVTMRMF